MKNINRKNIAKIPQEMNDRYGAFLCSASYENRSLVAADTLKEQAFKYVGIFAAQDCHSEIINTASVIKKRHLQESVIVPTKTRDPLFTANAMAKVINEIVNRKEIDDIIVDITTFTHEMLLILLKLIQGYTEKLRRVTCVYTSAKDYSVGDLKERKWLSKGCREVRSVVGYPGRLVPGKPTCLVVLVGYEHERAAKMIVEMDPEQLLLGKGISAEGHLTHKSHRDPMLFFHELVQDMASSRGTVEGFEFSCRDPFLTAGTLLNLIEENAGMNHIIVPLNTKISTVATAMAAFECPAVQVCYAEPETYNFEGYSSPDEFITIFDLNIGVPVPRPS